MAKKAPRFYFVPADPGTEALHFSAYEREEDALDEGEEFVPGWDAYVDRYPIVAWRIMSYDDPEEEPEDQNFFAKPVYIVGMYDPDGEEPDLILYRIGGKLMTLEGEESSEVAGKTSVIKNAKWKDERDRERREYFAAHPPYQPPKPAELVPHDPACRYVVTNGNWPCTCGAVEAAHVEKQNDLAQAIDEERQELEPPKP